MTENPGQSGQDPMESIREKARLLRKLRETGPDETDHIQGQPEGVVDREDFAVIAERLVEASEEITNLSAQNRSRTQQLRHQLGIND